jgi:hypothetical protein
MILFGEESLRVAIRNFVAHYHSERITKGWRIGSSSPGLVTLETLARSRDASA